MKTNLWIKLLKRVDSKRSKEVERKEFLRIMFIVVIRRVIWIEGILGRKEGKGLKVRKEKVRNSCFNTHRLRLLVSLLIFRCKKFRVYLNSLVR